MQIDAALTTTDLNSVPAAAAGIEVAGYDGVFSFDGQHDPFFPLLLAAEHTERVQLTTAVALALAHLPLPPSHQQRPMESVCVPLRLSFLMGFPTYSRRNRRRLSIS